MSTYLKAATEKDINLLFEWTNDPSVRQNSFNSAPIPFEDHQRWFHRVLNDPNTFLYILYDAEVPSAKSGWINQKTEVLLLITAFQNYTGAKVMD